MLRGKHVIQANGSPKPRSHYSQGIEAGGLVFVAGQLGIDPITGQVKSGIQDQTRQCLLNVKAIVEAAGETMDGIVRTGVYLRNIEDIEEMNKVYQIFFPEYPPARTTIQAALARPEFLVEIDAVCLKS